MTAKKLALVAALFNLATFGTGVVLLAGCPPVVKKVGIDLGICALHEIPAAIASALPSVETALVGSPTDWATELAALEAQGIDIAICTVRAAWIDIMGKLPAASLHAQIDPKQILGLDRAAVYLSSKGLTVAN